MSTALSGLQAVAILALLTGCSVPANEIAGRFWTAVQTGDLQTAIHFRSASSADLVAETAQALVIDEVLIGETLQNNRLAIVRTSLRTSTDGDLLRISFDTHLVQEEGVWRVDLGETHAEMTGAVVAANVRQVGEAIDEGLKELGEALERGADDLKAAIREALRELDAQLQ